MAVSHSLLGQVLLAGEVATSTYNADGPNY